MHLSDAESKRFLSLMALVQTYVITAGDFMLEDDEEFDGRVEVEVDLDDTRSDTPRLSDVSETDALRACEIAATFSDVFDGVFEDYGDDLDASDIRVLNLWQKGWFATYGAILSYTDNGDALLQTEMGVVQVSGVTQEISDIVPDVPMFIRTVIMPFEGSIVYCGLIAEYPINYGPGIVKSFDEVLAAIEEGREEVIRTSEVYCERLAAYKAKEREESFDELMSGIEHEVSKRDGETERAGLRRSVLLDLDESEREEAIDRQFWRELDLDDDLTLDIALERAIHAAPREDLRTALGDLDRNQLEDAAELVLHREPPSDRAEMIDAIVSACDDAVAIRQFLTLSSKKHYEFFLKIVKAEGRLVVDQDDDDELRAAQACPPFSFLYYDEDQEELIGAIVGDFLDQLTDEDVVTSINARERIIDMAHYADIAAGLYGVIPVEEFSELYGDDRHWDADFESVLGILGHLLYYQERDFTIESLGGVPYLIHNGIALQFLDDFDELSDSEMEGITESLVDFMAEILDAHERLERRPIGDIADAEDVQEWVIRRESALRLRDWLDEHVPDGESEYFFSDRILEDIYLSTWRPFDPSYVPQLLVEAYETTLESDEHIAMFNDLLSLATRFVNDIPRWDNYGYSAWELMEKQTGKKTFFNDDGSVKKVGRNDPCPCGSGKKYKKCCGR